MVNLYFVKNIHINLPKINYKGEATRQFPHKVKKRANLLSLLVILVLTLGASFAAVGQQKNRTLFEEAFKLYRQLESDSEKANKSENWDLVGRTLYGIYSREPTLERAPLCLYTVARVYEKKAIRFDSPEDMEKALKYSREFEKKYPDHGLIEDSWLRTARILESMGKKEEADSIYEKIVDRKSETKVYEIAYSKLHGTAPQKKTKSEAKPISSASKPEKQPITIKKIRHWSTDDYTRVVIESDREIKYSPKMLNPDSKLNTPSRLYLDLEKTVFDDSISIEPIDKKGLLEKISYGKNRPGISRIVLYLKDFEDYKVFFLRKSEKNPHFRIVMDIKGKGAQPEKIFAENPPSYDNQEGQTGDPVSVIPDGAVESLKQALGLKVRTIVIDPGHGGHDPGAIGPSGLKEKDVVLKIAKRLKQKLLEEGKNFGVENVYLTRETDKFISLEERTAIARKKKADVFISIHCNGARTKKAHGIETYILGFTNDQTSLQLAARENATTTKGLHSLRGILKDYVLSSKIEESQEIAGHVQESIVKNVSVKYKYINDKGVKKAPFVVLIGADVPSLLVEASFITNRREEKRLKSKAYIERIVDGIILGIKRYSMQTQRVS